MKTQNETLYKKDDASLKYDLDELQHRYHQIWRDTYALTVKDLLHNTFNLTKRLLDKVCVELPDNEFAQGRFATLYLSPKDYHRVHMPIDAELTSMTYIPGALFSVQPTTARVVPKLFARNERLAIFFNTKAGPMVMVGATIVGAIGTSWHGELQRCKKTIHLDYSHADLKKSYVQGEEMGYFKLGSTVVLLFANGEQIAWDKSLKAESIIRFGESMAATQ
jgi:phosphatidylserine decarboxylase